MNNAEQASAPAEAAISTAGQLAVAEAERRALAALDTAEVTEFMFHDAVHGAPLVAHILQPVMQAVPPGGRVLVIGGNPLLALALLAQGYACDLYRLADEILPAAVEAHVAGVADLKALAAGLLPATPGGYHAIILPFLLDLLPGDPRPLLNALNSALRPGGVAVLAGVNLVKLGSRLRGLVGKEFFPIWSNPPRQRPGGWPKVAEQRHYTLAEVRTLGEQASLGVQSAAHTGGYQAVNQGIPLRLFDWLALKGVSRLKNLATGWREFWVISFTNLGRRAVWSQTSPAAAGQNGAAEPAEWPFVSVILPTRDRSAMLRDCLENGLFRQTYPADRWEIILIDDGSADDTQAVIDELAPRSPAPLHPFKLAGVGAAAARNFGMRQARGQVLAHLDDDGRPLPNWLQAGTSAFEPGVAIVAGPIAPAPDQPIGFFTYVSRMLEDRGLYPTSNIFYLRDVVVEEGLFDESFGVNLLGRPMPGWDSDLAWRIKRKGYRAVFAPYALMLSFTFDLGLKGWLQETYKVQMLPSVIRRVPETRPGLFRVGGVVEEPLHLTWLISFAGLIGALLRRRPRPLLLFSPYLLYLGWLLRDEARRPTRWPKLAGKYGVTWLFHLLYFFWLLRGAIRARRFVL